MCLAEIIKNYHAATISKFFKLSRLILLRIEIIAQVSHVRRSWKQLKLGYLCFSLLDN